MRGSVCGAAAILASIALAQQKGNDIDSNFADEVFLVKPYPGSILVKGSSQRLLVDHPYGWAKTFTGNLYGGYGRRYKSSDDWTKVKAHFVHSYKSMGKVTTAGGPPTLLWCHLKSGESIAVNMSSTPGRGTDFEIYRFFTPRKSVKKK